MNKMLSSLLLFAALFSCKNEAVPVPQATKDFPLIDSLWTINLADIQEGNVGKGGIEAIDSPVHLAVTSAEFLEEDDLVIGLSYHGKAMAYPVKMLDYHEIVNDKIEDFAFTVSYSVLSGSGVVFERDDTESSKFGVSGLLYKSNLILYDKKTNSPWSQMLMKSIGGEKANSALRVYPSFQTTWKTWKSWYPDTQIMGPSAGVEPDYSIYPYGNYRENNDSLFFGISSPLQTIPNKERLLGIAAENGGKIFREQLFGQLNAYVTEQIAGQEVLIFGSGKDNYLMAYYTSTTAGNRIIIKESLLGKEPGGLFQDTQGTKWDINGLAYSGLRKGEQLKIPVNFMAYAFSWALFYPEFFTSER